MRRSLHPWQSAFVRRGSNKSGRVASIPQQLELPTIDEAIDGFDGLVPKSALTSPLKVTVPSWIDGAPGAAFKDTIMLLMAEDKPDPDFTEVARLEVDGPVENINRTLEIPVSRLREGQYLLKTHLILWSDNEDSSISIPLIVDTTPPYADRYPEPLKLPTFPTGVITDDDVDDVVVEIEPYADLARGDQIAFFWGEIPDDPTSVLPIGVIGVPSDWKYTIPKSVIEGVGNGVRYLTYALIDKAGNDSRLAVYAQVEVQLGPYPSGLQVPEVPRAKDDNLIDREDARDLIVNIPSFSGHQPYDVIHAYWGDVKLDPVPIGDAPSFPYPIRVRFDTVKEQYAGATGEVDTTVSYQIKRGSALLFPDDPLQTSLKVDLSVAGPENPDEPDPVNPDLDAVVVVGASGGLPNTLTPADADTNATATFSLYEPALLGQQIALFYGNNSDPVDTYDIKGDEGPGFEVKMEIPWSRIDAHGNDPKVSVYYKIYTVGGNNYQYSIVTEVNVSAVVISLPAPRFLNLSPSGFINCSTLQKPENGVDVQVPGNSRYFTAGMVVRLDWWGEDAGSIEIPGTRFPAEHTLLEHEVSEGFTLRVHPYDPHILSFYTGTSENRGVAYATYTVEIEGVPITSGETPNTLVLLGTGGGSCDIS